MEQPKQQSITIGGETYKGGLIYWGVLVLVVAVLFISTLNYWNGTVKILDEQVPVEAKHITHQPIP